MTDNAPTTVAALAPVPTEAELAQFDHRTVPSAIQVEGDVRISAPTIAALAPEAQQRVREKLVAVPESLRPEREAHFVQAELEQASYRFKVLAGPGEGANTYQRECFAIARDIYDLERQIDALNADMTDVVGYRNEVDANGNPNPVPIFRLSEHARDGRAQTVADLRRKVALLEGREGDHRRSEAAKDTANQIAQQNEQLEVMAEAKRRAEVQVREERIEHLAESFAKSKRTNIG